MRHILVIAPDSDLRQSLQFALEAEGYAVTACARMDDPTPGDGFDCTVLDHHAADKDRDAAIAFCDLFRPVVLLANRESHPLAAAAFRTVLKPMLGPALARAVGQAIEVRASPT